MFDTPLPVLKIPAFLLDRTRQQHSPYFLITVVSITLALATVSELGSGIYLCVFNDTHNKQVLFSSTDLTGHL